LVVGLVVGLMQAVTQINDSAIGFLPRLVALVLVCWFAGGWAVERLAQYLAAALQRMSQG
jgi:flagellar biosynthetic protein FliQ